MFYFGFSLFRQNYHNHINIVSDVKLPLPSPDPPDPPDLDPPGLVLVSCSAVKMLDCWSPPRAA